MPQREAPVLGSGKTSDGGRGAACLQAQTVHRCNSPSERRLDFYSLRSI